MDAVVEPRLVELRRVLDLVLRQVDEDLLLDLVDPVDQPDREHDLLPEDPGAGVHDEGVRAKLVRPLVDHPDLAIHGLDVVAGQVDVSPCRLGKDVNL